MSGPLANLHSGLGEYDIPYGGWIYNQERVAAHSLIDGMGLSFREAIFYWSSPLVAGSENLSQKNKIEFQTGIIDLSDPLEDILQKNISRKRRQSIRTARKKGVEIERLNKGTLHIFLEQSRLLKTSIGSDPHPDEFYFRLFDKYDETNRVAAFATKLDKTYLASGMMIRNRHMAHLWIAGKPEAASNINVPRNEPLMWEAIQWAKKGGSRYFDLCVLEPDRLPQIAQYKLSFTDNVVPFYYFSKRKFSYRLVSKIRRILSEG
jgi:lipid II:glycine glycyltransferase (peptidoglycan interpeptide bridge formation enzyme)